jgi:membrane-bound lytic murein transglycosylase
VRFREPVASISLWEQGPKAGDRAGAINGTGELYYLLLKNKNEF